LMYPDAWFPNPTVRLRESDLERWCLSLFLREQ
jgi:hypothetical protein